ncbi:unnamed protein product [Paramecium sonneborni]|uniref:Uncharacterized protein n=1 Tax=Paramecium sonneborni TaxID=65129 RepID=A0A8S1PRL3_9CILI|nr:unnamed protein product [Paramecium sonneborni]
MHQRIYHGWKHIQLLILTLLEISIFQLKKSMKYKSKLKQMEFDNLNIKLQMKFIIQKQNKIK